jgi:hypothetical protein
MRLGEDEMECEWHESVSRWIEILAAASEFHGAGPKPKPADSNEECRCWVNLYCAMHVLVIGLH